MKKMCGMVALVLAVVFATSGIVDINAAKNDAYLVHVVQPGETLYRIGRLHGVAWTVLAEYNGLDNPHLIFPGKRVRVPGPSHTLTAQYIVQRMDDFAEYTRENVQGSNSQNRSRYFFSSIAYLRYIYDYHTALFAEAVLLTPRNGRFTISLLNSHLIPQMPVHSPEYAPQPVWQSFILFPPYNSIEGRFLFREMMLESYPDAQYIYDLFSDALFFQTITGVGSIEPLTKCASFSRLVNAFIRNPVCFFEAGYLAQRHLSRWERFSVVQLLYWAREFNHPFLFDEWFGLLEYALTHELSDSAHRQVTHIIHVLNGAEIYEGVLGFPGNVHFRETIVSGFTAHLPRIGFSSYWTSPDEGRTLPFSPFPWTKPGEPMPYTTHLYDVSFAQPLSMFYVRFTYSVCPTHVLRHPFWQWLNLDIPGFYPVCPIWFITLMGNNLVHPDNRNPVFRDVLIIELVAHVAEIRERGFDIYRDILTILTDTDSVFDKYTRETFERVQYELGRHGLFFGT